MMPQWDFLDFLRDEAAAFPGFALEMEAPVVEAFVEERAGSPECGSRTASELRAPLTIAADGRSSLVAASMLPLEDLGAPMDVFWFRLAKPDEDRAGLRGNVESGRMLVMIDRGDYWQCAFVIPKGDGRGLSSARDRRRSARKCAEGRCRARFRRAATRSPTSTCSRVKLDRLTHWHRPGLLAIGDAAHAMSPIGGIGINLAIQDAVAAANILAGPLAAGQRRRSAARTRFRSAGMFPTRVIQGAQKAAQERVIGRVLGSGGRSPQAPRIVRLLDRFPLLRRIPGPD